MTKTKNDVVDIETADILFGVLGAYAGNNGLNQSDIDGVIKLLNRHYYKVVCGCLPKEIHTVTMPATYKGWNKAIQEAKQSIAKALGVGKDGG